MHSDVIPDTLPELVDQAVQAAAATFPEFRRTTGSGRAALLRGISDGLGRAAEDLAAIAEKETGLSQGRLTGEIAQTQVDLRTLADWVEAGNHLGLLHDPPSDDFPLGPRPDLRKFLVPVGVVLNFAASNFPFAFSVAGVDTASALAAGCPVVVKAHPGHPQTSLQTFVVIAEAIAAQPGVPRDIVQLIFGEQAGVRALRDPGIAAASFTGSLAAGRALAAIAASREVPIPFYGELGSINPVVVTPGALEDGSRAIAQEFVDAFTDSAGQVCTKPGLLFLPEGSGLDEQFADAVAAVEEHRMLYPLLGARYAQRRDETLAIPGIRVIAPGSVRTDDDGQVWVRPTVVALGAADAAEEHLEAVADEVFGPLSVVIEYRDVREVLAALGRLVPGSLTVSVHVAETEEVELADLVADLQYLAGRVVVNEWPMAVYITPAQHHGGPSPATTLDVPAATSVGPGSLARFQRAVAWQNAPLRLLPREIRDSVLEGEFDGR